MQLNEETNKLTAGHSAKDENIILKTERLFLRKMNMDDYEALYAVLADPKIMQHYPYSFDEERVRSWIERNMNSYTEN